jgi:hypothetical protein
MGSYTYVVPYTQVRDFLSRLALRFNIMKYSFRNQDQFILYINYPDQIQKWIWELHTFTYFQILCILETRFSLEKTRDAVGVLH